MKRRTKKQISAKSYDIFWLLMIGILIVGASFNLGKPLNLKGVPTGDEPNKTIIQNQIGANLVVVVDEAPMSRGVAVVAHGLGGDKGKPDILAIADVFRRHGFTVVRYDASNARGESGGYIEDAKATTYVQDMTSVVSWAKSQLWFKQPLVLAGHSLGATAAAFYAEAHSAEVAGLVLISGVVSGTLHFQEAPKRTPSDWEQTWQQISSSWKQEGSNGSVNWFAFVIDLMRFNVLKEASGLGMPVLIIVGEKDELAPVSHQQLLYASLPGPKEIKIVVNAGHNFQSESEIAQLKEIIDDWLINQLP